MKRDPFVYIRPNLSDVIVIQMPSKEEVVKQLESVIDPHTGTDVHSMGLIGDLKAGEDSVSLTFTPTSPFCPMGVQLAVQIKKALMKIEGLEEEDIDITIQGHINAEQINEHLKKKGE